MSTKHVAVVLAGCGVYDGSEIHEAVLSLLYLAKSGVTVSCFAPDIEQMHVVNHLTGQPVEEVRNVLVESARIARGQVSPLSQANADDYDALIVSGGFGVAKNLCSFAQDGAAMTINDEFLTFAKSFAKAHKPVGLMCIAPVLSAAIFGEGVRCTVGSDADTASQVAITGANHTQAGVKDIVIDESHNLVTTPAYMLGPDIAAVSVGIEKLIAEVLTRA